MEWYWIRPENHEFEHAVGDGLDNESHSKRCHFIGEYRRVLINRSLLNSEMNKNTGIAYNKICGKPPHLKAVELNSLPYPHFGSVESTYGTSKWIYSVGH